MRVPFNSIIDDTIRLENSVNIGIFFKLNSKLIIRMQNRTIVVSKRSSRRPGLPEIEGGQKANLEETNGQKEMCKINQFLGHKSILF